MWIRAHMRILLCSRTMGGTSWRPRSRGGGRHRNGAIFSNNLFLGEAGCSSALLLLFNMCSSTFEIGMRTTFAFALQRRVTEHAFELLFPLEWHFA
jgi:hypothetical protein